MALTYTRVPSPLGRLVLIASDAALAGVCFPTSRHGAPPSDRAGWVEDDGSRPASAILERARQQLAEYFAGARTAFDLPLAMKGATFERRVWRALEAIPYGTTLSYGELARRLGAPRATRAVGAANGKNPIPIIVPCHRVVGVGGALTGFGGGLDRKRWLLEHEGALLALGR
jgi:methylated-DNA-[protein]-cysteine S-methyltransferase